MEEKIEEWLDNHDDDDYCRYCIYRDDCRGMTSDGSGQPCYPPCTDRDIEEMLNFGQLKEDIKKGEWDD